MSRFKIKNLSEEQKALRRRILEISHLAHFSHLGSCLSAIDLIDSVYKHKQKEEVFILSNGHAGIAWYVVLEKHGILNKDVIKKLNVHPDRNLKYGIHVSTGSLGQGLPIALGMAVSNRNKNVYCMISDGECTEGSIWEALRLAKQLGLDNLTIFVNANGWGAYDPIRLTDLVRRIKAFGAHVVKVDGHDCKSLLKSMKIKVKSRPLVIFATTTVEQFPFLKGQDAHYFIMKEEDYSLAMEILK